MFSFKNWSIYRKMMGLVFIMIIFMLCIGYTGYNSMNRISEDFTHIYKKGLLPTEWLGEGRVILRTVESNIWQHILTSDKDEEQRLEAKMNGLAVKINESFDNFEKVIQDTEDAAKKEKFDKIKTKLAEYRNERTKVVETSKSGQKQEAYWSYKSAVTKIDEMNNLLEELSGDVAKEADIMNEANIAHTKTATISIIINCLVCFILGFGISVYIANLIIKPVKALQSKMAIAGSGDLTARVEIDSLDELGELSSSFNAMIKGQADVVGVVSQAANDIARASEEIAVSTGEVTTATVSIGHGICEVANEATQGTKSTMEASMALLELSSLLQIAQSKANSDDCSINLLFTTYFQILFSSEENYIL